MYGIGFAKGSSHPGSGVAAMLGTGWGLYVAADGDARIGLDSTNGIIRSTGVAYVNTNQRVFADNYHPNADRLTTARNINGVAFNGTANITVADATKLPKAGGTMTGSLIIDTGSTSTNALVLRGTTPTLSFIDQGTSDDFYIHVNSNNFYVLRDTAGADLVGTGWDSPHPLQLEGDTNIGYVFGSRMFHETYHPNADTLTTARTINGVSFNGSANITVADSTKLPLAGGTMTGNLTIPSKIIHAGDTDTYFEFHGANLARMVLAGAEVQEWGANYTLFSDGDSVRLGSSSDFRMLFDGTDTLFRNYAHAGGNINFQGEDTEGTNHALLYMMNDLARPYLRLFENGGERLRTLSGGVGVTGLTVGDVDASPHNAGGLQISNSNNEKIVLSGSTDPFIRFQEGTNDKAYIQWNDSGYLDFRNMESGEFKFQSTVDGQASELILIRNDTTTATGNDLGSINFGHTDGAPDWPSQWVTQLPARIVAEATETTGGSDDGARLRFFTKATNVEKAIDSVESMRLEHNGDAVFYHELSVPNTIFHSGDTDTYMQFSAANSWRVVTGGSQRLLVTNDTMTVAATLSMSGHTLNMNNNDITGVDQIFHHGDTNTYIQFHAADQFRVVTGGTERLEVNNTRTQIDNLEVTGTLNGGKPSTSASAVGSVGSYAWLARNGSTAGMVAGSTFAGSSLVFASVDSVNAYNYDTVLAASQGASPSGTWRIMGTTHNSGQYTKGCVFVRIS
jgi:hypothetical protein